MEKLFDESEIFQKERPTTITEQQREQLYVDIANDIRKYRYSNADIDIIVEDISDLSLNDSGFELAKDLEDYGRGEYAFTGEFIDFLDSVSFRPYKVLQENVKEWVRAHKIKLNLGLGTKLKVVERLNKNMTPGELLYITGLVEDRACYILNKENTQNIGTIISSDEVEKKCEVVSQ